MYIVVSVDPCITDDTLPMKLSVPYVLNISLNTANELEPDIGLNIAKGNTSLGKLIRSKKLLNIFVTL